MFLWGDLVPHKLFCNFCSPLGRVNEEVQSLESRCLKTGALVTQPGTTMPIPLQQSVKAASPPALSPTLAALFSLLEMPLGSTNIAVLLLALWCDRGLQPLPSILIAFPLERLLSLVKCCQ